MSSKNKIDFSLVRTYDFPDLAVGMSVHYTTTISRTDVNAYARLSGDISPLHIDPEFRGSSSFGQNLVHGMLIASYFSALIGVFLPGRQALLSGIQLDFVRPIPVGSSVTISGAITALAPAFRTMVLKLLAFVDGKICVQGEARIKLLPITKNEPERITGGNDGIL